MHPTDQLITEERRAVIINTLNSAYAVFDALIDASLGRFVSDEISLRQHIDNVRAAATELAQKCAEI